jgi:hypothetical protein
LSQKKYGKKRQREEDILVYGKFFEDDTVLGTLADF